MILRLRRDTFRSSGTSGVLTVDYEAGAGPQAFGFVIEDCDRGLTQGMHKTDAAREKLKGSTAIPTGRYQIKRTMSPRFQRMMPLLLDVPGFGGIRIHAGNDADDTEGCLLPAMARGTDETGRPVGHRSRVATDWIDAEIAKVEAAGGKVWIEITREPLAWSAYRGIAA